jgi:hypothetical protein
MRVIVGGGSGNVLIEIVPFTVRLFVFHTNPAGSAGKLVANKPE